LNYFLATNAVSYLVERRPYVVVKVSEIGGPGLLSISAITLAELSYGMRLMPGGRRKAGLLESLEQMLRTGMDVRPFSADAARAYSDGEAKLREEGIGFASKDLAIASVAMAENKTLASNDSFFEHVRRLCRLTFERWEP